MFKHIKKDDIEILDFENEEKIKSSKKWLAFVFNKKKSNSEDIELLDVNEKKKGFLNNKLKVSLSCVGVVAVIIMVLSIAPGTNVIKTGTKRLLNGLGIYTEEVKSVEIQSNNYEDPGTWHINKSAEWTGANKAQVVFDVNTILKTETKLKDTILVLDISGSMAGEKMEKAISDSKELVEYLLTNGDNKVAIITFDTTSTIISPFSNDKDDLLLKLDSIEETTGATTYYGALKNVETVMESYVKEEGKDVVTLFLTDGYPNVDTPNQNGVYSILKDKYPYMTINGVQYEMGGSVIEEIKEITDDQWIADRSNLNNVLFKAVVSPIAYENLVITDYINSDYFEVSSNSDIKVTTGSITLTEEDNNQKVIWDLGNTFITGSSAKMTINLTLKEAYANNDGYYPTNKRETISYKLPKENETTKTSTETPVLDNAYDVIYETNTPSGCNLENIESEKHFIYQNVVKKNEDLFCNGYLFKGWEVDTEDSKDIKKVNDDVFIMPGHNVTIRATWAKASIVKSVEGTVHETTTLYKTVEEDAREGVYAFEYTGPHKDSMDTSKSTEKIYYYQLNNSNRTGFLDKINVLFANHCWQMIRTTDTGGVKLLYNGEPEDGKCLSTRGNHPGYTGGNTSLNSTYWYGTNYTYDSSTGKFKISGTTEQLEPTVENLSKLEKKYTCMLTTEEGTCSTIYVVKIVDNKAYGYPINSNSHYSIYGNTAFGGGISTIGYMYGNNYKNSNLNISNSLSFTKLNGMIENASLDTTYWFADSIDYNNTSRKYNLVDPYQVSTPSDFSDLVGKYTFLNSNENNTGNNVYYIVAVNETTVYYKIIANGNLLSYYDPMVFGEDVTENPDGTFTLTDTTSVSLIDYYTDYENYKEKYTCGGSASSCSNPGYITSITLKNYNYIDIGIKMMIGKEREGSNLVDTLLARRDLLVKNSEDYSDYKYTCGTESNVCSGGDIRLILSYSDTGYTYIKNYYYGNDVYWDGEKYTLVDIVGMENYNNMDALATHHYVCQRAVTTTCNEVYYILSTMASDRQESSIVLTGGVNIAQALQNAYTNNINDSNIKFGVDAWYKNYMLSYDNYIEDTIFCNDRKIREIGPFNSNGGRINSSLVFNSYQSNSNTYNGNLDCAYITDQFSVSNPSAQLTYKVGLMTLPEQYWFSVRSNSGPNTQNWLMTPGLVSDGTKTFGTTVGASSVSFLFNANGVRPVISLIPGIEYYDGDGSMESPYLIDVG